VKQETKRGLFATTVLAGLAITMPALAQQAPVQTTPAAPAAESDDEDVVVVTGSRLVRQDFTAISPVTTVGAQDIELTATLSVEQLLNELPQVIPGNTVTSNNAGGEDFATIDLRGLGTQRTLVIVNGERVPASSTTGNVDLNTIPAGLVDRIEVVTGGASAVYGSDAIAGVVNFILKDDYEGAQITTTVASAEDGNAQEFNADILVGGNFADGKGNLTAFGSYYNREGVFQSAYDFSAVSGALICDPTDPNCDRVIIADSPAELNAALAAGSLGVVASGGSATPPWGQISNNAANPFGGLAANPATAPRFNNVDTDCNPATAGVAVNGGTLSFNQLNQLVPQRNAAGCAVPSRTGNNGESTRYNFAPDNYLIIPAERLGFSVIGNYAITDSINMDMMVTYANSEAIVQLAPTPITGLSIPVTSPLIPADLAAALASRPNPTANFTMAWRASQVGPRIGTFTNNSLNSRVGISGELPGDWEWRVNLGYGESQFTGILQNNVNKTALLQGLQGCANIPVNARLPGCVDVNIFGPNVLTAAMANFLRINTKEQGTYEQSSVSGYVRGDLFELPAGPVSAVFGAEYRDDEGAFLVDDAQRTGNIFGFNATQSVGGNRDVYEYYTEVAVPLLAEAPLAHYLGVEAGFRYSDYSTIGGVESYKVGMEYAPVSWFKFRGVYNEAIRAPSLLETFQNGDQGFPSYTDPCNDPPGAATISAAVQALCLSTGVPAGVLPTFAQNNAQVQAFAFGNQNLSPETAETITFGAVFEPDWLPIGDLKLSVDYYDILLRDPIVPRGAQTIINSCYLQGQVSDCANIVRNAGTGQIDSVNTSLVNLGKLMTRGIDVQTEFGVDIDEVFSGAPGRLRVNWLYSYLDNYSINNQNNDFRGTNEAGIGGALFPWRSVATFNYELGDWAFQVRHIYTPEMESQNFGEANISPAAEYVDTSVRYDVTDKFRVTLVVDNLFDETPPQTAEGFFAQANTDVQIYRVLGRSFSLSGRLRF
jgi:outer membrane receptor protein involved in Fe transport